MDTNIIMSALIKDSATRFLILEGDFEMFMPETSILEIQKYLAIIQQKSGLSLNEINLLFSSLKNRIKIISKVHYLSSEENAKSIMKNIDIEDWPFIALALSFHNDGIWTEDKHFEKQNKIKVWKTSDIINTLFKK